MQEAAPPHLTMSKQTRIKTADEIRAQQPVILSETVLDPADPELPKPQGTVGEKPINQMEALRLKRTLDAGGLVDDHAISGTPARARFKPITKAT